MSSRVDVQQQELTTVEPAEGDLVMRVSVDERGPLSRAMSELNDGDSRGFCDSMWLGFGDRWKRVLKELTEGGFVAVLDHECSEGIRITERGRALAANLIKATRQTA